MTFRWAYQLGNFFGILSIRKNFDIFETSKFHLVLNGLKIYLLMISKHQIDAMFAMNISPRQFHHRPSLFANGFVSVHQNQLIVTATLILIFQFLSAQKNVSLINLLWRFRLTVLKVAPEVTTIFKLYELSCSKNFVIMIALSTICFFIAFLSTMRVSFAAFLGLLLYNIPYFVNMSCIWYFQLIIQFLTYSQRALNMYASGLKYKSSSEAESMIKSLSKMQTSLFSIKQYFMSFLRLQIFVIMFYYISEIVFQVSWLETY